MMGSEIAPGVHRLEEDIGPRFMAQYVLAGAERTVLIDSGLSETFDSAITPYLASIGLPPAALDDLILSHADVDHVGSNRRVREVSPTTRLWCGEADRRWIESNACMLAENYRWSEPYGFSLGEDALGWIERELGGDAPIDVGLRGGETLRLGPGQRWEVLALPGHTYGHIGLWHAGERIALVIDAVLGRGVHDRDGVLLIPPRIYDLPAYRRTIATLRALSPELMLTAHYPIMDRRAAAEFLDLCDGFCDDVLRVTRAVEAAGEPSLLAVVAALDEQLGPYPEFVVELAAIARSALAVN
jgi:glyoxylase-like metal-dependent hydrolase (beta-lactamase superfamily II)